MHRATSGDLQEPFALGLVQIAFQMYFASNLVEHPLFSFAILTVFGMKSIVAEPYLNVLQRPFFPLRIHAECNGGSGPERGQ